MKKQIFLSFKPNFFRPILYDIKKYEYRKRFCKEATTVYLYLSAPLQVVIGVMEMGVPIMIKETLDKYPGDNIINKRAQSCIESGELYAIPIESLQLYKEPISISKINQIAPTFRVPRCYLDITKFNEVYTYLHSQDMYDIEFYNEHYNLYENNFGCTCKEMELTLEFAQKDIIYTSNPKYSIVKCGYLNDKYQK